jgi:HSP20 family protein
MADPQTTIEPKGVTTKPREESSLSAGAPTGAEARSFTGDGASRNTAAEAVGAARDISQLAAHATRQAAERSRQAATDVATSWRGAFEPFLAMQLEMNRWFDDVWRHATGLGALPALRPARPFGLLGAAPLFGLPPTDVKETHEAYVIQAELPGLSREDVDIQLRDSLLLISGHKREQKEDAGSAYRVSERRYGRFDRSFPVPADADRERVEASFRDGLLTVTLPKSRAAGPGGAKIAISG